MPITQSELASDPFSGEDGDIAGIYDEIQEEDGADECPIGRMRARSDGQLEILAADPARAYGLRMG